MKVKANWIEVSGFAAVVVSLVFLAIETRQNTQAIEASTSEAALEGEKQFLMQAWQDPDTIIAWTKSEPTDAEVLRHFYSLTMFVTYKEDVWAQYQRGLLDKDTWERHISSIPEALQFARNRLWWRNYGEHAFDPDFVAEVNALIADTPVLESSVPDNVRLFFEERDCRSNVSC